MTTPLTRAELAEAFPSADWRVKFQQTLGAVTLLRNCIIEKSYKISDDLNAAIVLSDAGKRVRDQMVTKEQVPPKEANMLTMLAFAHVEPLVDVDRIDLSKLIECISKEVRSGALKFPFIFSRALYDRAADLFPEEREYLRHDDTLKLLKDQPQGVFQVGPYVTGPLGVVTSSVERDVIPTTSVPLQHCSDHSCHAIHRVQLATSIEASVNRLRPALNKVLDEVSDDPSEWNGFFSDIDEIVHNPLSVHDFSTAVYTISDAFDDHELSVLFVGALKHTDGRLLAVAKKVGLSGAPEDIAASADRATQLQLLLTESDESLVRVVNRAIAEGDIEVPEGEVRRARINSRHSSGEWHLRTEIGRRGSRVIGATDGLPLLRLTSLVNSLFDTSSAEDMDILSWALRNVPGAAVEDRLAEFIRTASPVDIVESLVLVRKSNVEKTTNQLHIAKHETDEDLVESVIWKLGFGQTPQPDLRDDYWQKHDSLQRLVKTAGVNVNLNVQVVRSEAANYFVALEAYLLDSLLFATWALLHDHYISQQPFIFREAAAAAFAKDALEEAGSGLPDRPNLSDLVRGFSSLKSLLGTLREDDTKHERPTSEYPKYAGKTDLQRFPFVHNRPFLDLTAESQVAVVNALQAAVVALDTSGIMTARNGLLHAGREVPKPQDLADALEVARRGLQEIENLGFSRSTFQSLSTEIDAWGRGTTVLRASTGNEISFSSPSAYRWLGLPTLRPPQYLVQGAVFAPPNMMLRFRRGYSSRYEEYWTDYPKRREPGNRVVASQAESLSTPIETGSFVGSRAD